jgi:hypothetical protein
VVPGDGRHGGFPLGVAGFRKLSVGAAMLVYGSRKETPHARIEFNQSGIDAMYNQVGQRLKATLERVVREAPDLPVDDAAEQLQQELSRVGAQFKLEVCRDAVETMRRGETFTLQLR